MNALDDSAERQKACLLPVALTRSPPWPFRRRQLSTGKAPRDSDAEGHRSAKGVERAVNHLKSGAASPRATTGAPPATAERRSNYRGGLSRWAITASPPPAQRGRPAGAPRPLRQRNTPPRFRSGTATGNSFSPPLLLPVLGNSGGHGILPVGGQMTTHRRSRAAGLTSPKAKSLVRSRAQVEAARELLVENLDYLGPKKFQVSEVNKKAGVTVGSFGVFGSGQAAVGNSACSWQMRASVTEAEPGVSHPMKGESRAALLGLLGKLIKNVAFKVSANGNAMFHAQGSVWVEGIGSVNYSLQVVLSSQ